MRICIISDTHLHNWTQFSTIDKNGVNSRLKIILKEMYSVAEKAKEAGCEALVHCGDLFHVKGKVDTSVLVPTTFLLEKINSLFPKGIVLITGNHDIDFSENSNVAGNSLFIPKLQKVVSKVENGRLLASDDDILFIAWHQDIDTWKSVFEKAIEAHQPRFVFTHAPIDGAVKGVPAHGLTQEYLDSIGFKGKIFAGHYHNHKRISEQLISVGALCHHSWSDVGSKAGFVILDTDTGEWNFRESKAPKFVDLEGVPETVETTKTIAEEGGFRIVVVQEPEEKMKSLISGNYVRLTTDKEIKDAKEIRDFLISQYGAKEALVNIKAKKAEVIRTETVSGITRNPLSDSICVYLDEVYKSETEEFRKKVKVQALDILGLIGAEK